MLLTENTVSQLEFLNDNRDTVITLMRTILNHAQAIKLNLFVECEFAHVHG